MTDDARDAERLAGEAWCDEIGLKLRGKVSEDDFHAIFAAGRASLAEENEWKYCPECGSSGCEHVNGKTGRQCTNCGQEWFTDIDYTEVVQANLAELSTLPEENEQIEVVLENLISTIDAHPMQNNHLALIVKKEVSDLLARIKGDK